MKRNLNYLWSLTPGMTVVMGNFLGGWWGALNIFYSLGVIALAEWIIPPDTSNAHSEEQYFPTSILYLHIPLQVLALGSFFYALSHGYFTGWQYAAATASVGIHTGSSSIVVAHELIHKIGRAHV